jgi:ATPase subunit of ABC transporter with duplicated ATPase domains
MMNTCRLRQWCKKKIRQENAKKQAKIKELQTFVNRFSANASKAKQATSRARQLEKIKLDDIKPSSRRSPYIRFNPERKLQRFAVQVEKVANGYDGELVFDNINFAINAGEKVAIIGPNGIGKTTLIKTLIDELPKKSGDIKWPEHAHYGYFPQQHHHAFELDDNLMEWIGQWRKEGDDEQSLRAVLGRMLFSGDDIRKKVRVLSGGERARMLFAKLILTQPNILILDEPTNHLDMESIEALNYALEQYAGTVIFVSHDRQLVSSLATRVLALTKDGFEDFKGTYDEYLASKELVS